MPEAAGGSGWKEHPGELSSKLVLVHASSYKHTEDQPPPEPCLVLAASGTQKAIC